MKKYLALLSFVFAAFANAGAQETFLLKDASKIYDVKIRIEKCAGDICEGKGAVYLLKKNQKAAMQTIRMPNIYLELGADRRPTANLVELYGMNNSGVIFDDFNFDGAPDLALRNGNDGAYGGPSYDVLLFAKSAGKFVKNAALTKMASENLGMFDVDRRTKTIETFTKSGCCWHKTTRYKMIGSRPVKIYVLTEDSTLGDGNVRLTTEKPVNGKWRSLTRTVPVKDYYREN